MEKTRASVINTIRGLPFFDSFTDEDIRTFTQHLSLRLVDEGTELFREGDIGDYLFFVVDGMVEICLKPDGKQHKVIADFGPGATVGEMSLLDEFERSATVRASTQCEILILTKSKFDWILEEHPKIGIKVLKGLAKNISLRLRSSTGRFKDIL